MMLRYIVCLLLAIGVSSEVKILRMNITSHVFYRFNKVIVNTVMVNDGNFIDDMIFQLAVPNDAFITNFTMKMNSVYVRGRIEDQVKKVLNNNNQYNPENYDLRPRGTSFFRIRAQAPANAKVEFSLVYEELLVRRGGQYDFTLFLHPGKVVEDFTVTVKIQESRALVNLRVPPLRGELLPSLDENKAQNDMVTILKPDPKSAIIEFHANAEQQLKESPDGLKGLFTINYDIERGDDAGDMLIFNGYFLHFFAPSHFETLPRDIMFVLDDSGSMADTKLMQMKESLYKILDTLKAEDRIHFIQFSNIISPRKQGFVKVTPESIIEAKMYVKEKFIAQGGTNMNSAILKGFASFKQLPESDEARAKMLVFLTDGQATAGETDREQILRNLRLGNFYNVSVFAIGFGADADYALMKRISFENKGIACRIYDASDADIQMYAFFQQINKILSMGISFEYDNRYIQDATIRFGDGNYYSGSELGVMGKLSKGYQGDIGVKVNELRNGHSVTMKNLNGVKVLNDPPMFMTDTEYRMTMERMWAFIFVKYVMRNLYMRKYKENFGQMYSLLKQLSIKYHFLNSFTQMKLDLPEDKGGLPPKFIDITPDYQRDNYAMSRSGITEYLRGMRRNSGLVYDPHFIVELPTLEFPLCFEVIAKSGQNILLLNDPVTGDRVTATVVASKVKNKDGHFRTYLGAIKITQSVVGLYVTPRMIRVNGIPLSWGQESTLKIKQMKIVITGSGQHMNVYLNNTTHLMVQRILVSHNDRKRTNFLNFYITDYTGLSSDTTGLLGQFAHTDIYSKKSKKFHMLSNTQELHGNDGNGKNFNINATLIERLELLDSRSTKPCWKIPMTDNSALFSGKNMKNFFVKSL